VPDQISIPFDPPLDATVNIRSGKYGLILAHGKTDDISDGILPSLQKKLAEKNISSISFRFPFRQKGLRQIDDVPTLDGSYLAVWEYVSQNYEQVTWLVGGIDIGAETAIRATSLIMTDDGSVPVVIALNYPLYPPNRPETIDAASLGAIMGDALFVQGSESNQGSYDRMRNQLMMMVPHADIVKIRGANHEFVVKEKSFDRVAFWISNDIERFIKNGLP
jgi:predicted alpha/beta-hydrolase family hydrolase